MQQTSIHWFSNLPIDSLFRTDCVKGYYQGDQQSPFCWSHWSVLQPSLHHSAALTKLTASQSWRTSFSDFWDATLSIFIAPLQATSLTFAHNTKLYILVGPWINFHTSSPSNFFLGDLQTPKLKSNPYSNYPNYVSSWKLHPDIQAHISDSQLLFLSTWNWPIQLNTYKEQLWISHSPTRSVFPWELPPTPPISTHLLRPQAPNCAWFLSFPYSWQAVHPWVMSASFLHKPDVWLVLTILAHNDCPSSYHFLPVGLH